MAQSAAMFVTFALLGLFSIHAAAQGPAPAPVAGGSVPLRGPVPAPAPVAFAPAAVPSSIAPAPTANDGLNGPAPAPTANDGALAPIANDATPAPTADDGAPTLDNSGASRMAWSGVAIASVLVATMLM